MKKLAAHYAFKCMRTTVGPLLLVLGFIHLSWARTAAGQELLNRSISITVQEKSLKSVLHLIEKQAEIKFSYSPQVVPVQQRVTLNAENRSLGEVLDLILKPVQVRYVVAGRQIILSRAEPDQKTGGIAPAAHPASEQMRPQERRVEGKVTDEAGAGLPGVSVVVKGTQAGTVTDVDGKFAMEMPESADLLVFSFVGYLPQEVEVGSRTQVDIVLKPDTKALEEVVVVGYGTVKKRDLTGAIASVNVEQTKLQPNTNASQILRGTTAGVQVTDNGRPGQAGEIRIRGINSISGSTAPLIVLDGIIYAGGSLSDINPSDIESIDVLKDASSTAIYGSLAANGVIEVTTKRGKSGKPVFSFNTYVGASDYAFLPKLLNAEQYLAARKDAEIADGGPVPFQPVELENIAAGRSIKPFEEIRQSAPMSNYELSVSGKTERTSYFFSGGYLKAKSPVKGDNFSRISSRLNLSVDATDWLKLGVNSGFTSRDDSGVRADLVATTYLSPFASLFLDDGKSPRPLPQDIGLVANPLIGHALNQRKSITNALFANGFADVRIWNGLSYKLNAAYTRTDSKEFKFNPSYEPLNRLGSGSKYHGERQNITVENIISYKQQITPRQSLDVTLLYGAYEQKSESSMLSSQNIFNDALGYNALEIGEGFNIDASALKNRQLSSMARLGYSVAGKYLATVSIRRDGFSAFGAGKKFGVFPAVALSWNVTEEAFMHDLKEINFLKLRASWGRNGNRGVKEYASLSQVEQKNYVFGDGSATSVGLSPSSLANPSLGWETSESTNIGADVQVFNSRISASVNYYWTRTYDLLLEQAIPNTNGFEKFLRNVGQTRNHGLEIDLKSTNIERGGFTWNTSLAFSFNRNRVVKLTGADVNNDGREDDDIASGWFIGHPLMSNYSYVFDGIFQEGDDLSLIPGAMPGDIRFKDISGPDGVPDGKITPQDRTVISNAQPRYNLGITNVWSYKGLSLSAAFNIRHGGYSRMDMLNPGTNFYDQANFLDVPYWTPGNPIDTRPRINYRNPLGYGFYESRSFARLQDVSLSYNIPDKLLKPVKIGSLQVYVSAKNLATITKWKGWDPEFGGGGRGPGENGPLLKTFIAGLNISF
ncbi:TonB-dependent receptor [Dyadobacter fermentans]|uniref:TonB-dependent receptor plug n=1 Tax=Dyadobacter fermentans (strain ATCC 700827 / DSM 18053 / CIP 107007 / KCTC 52180 / NS114) TaxID=471854 RepID=C6VYT6_DYAFD|nr:TonB-dependent receptor [Dyadobacter fermentans]ACT93441.1 TonB-dependent receptor plug [Dyadobacter fermentans DSM 18053]